MNIAIVAVLIPQIKNSTDVSIRKLSVVNTDECGNDDYNIIRAVSEEIVTELQLKSIAKWPKGIQMYIVKRDTIENDNLSTDEICTRFIVDEIFSRYM